MNKSMEILAEVLGKNEDLVVDGMLDKNMVAELARKYDKGLLTALCGNKDLKKLFFEEIDGQLVFKKDIFLQFISQKEFLPDSYTKFSQKIGLATAGGDLLTNDNRVVLNWPYKDCVLEGGQTKEDQKRDEVFFNEILAPDQISTILEDKVFTNWKRYDKDGEHKLDKLVSNDNLIIKGNNLVVLHSLKKRFAGKIKLIYIDPPYNTKSDSFGYNDNFNHSTWLTFMKNRLEVAKKLLCNSGTIYVQCDSREMAYLKVEMDEIFGKENYLSTITVKAKAGGGVGQESYLFDVNEYIHIYAKDQSLARNYLPFITDELKENTTKVYNNIIDIRDELGKYKKTISGGNVGEIKVYEHDDFSVSKVKDTEDYYDHFEHIFRTTNPQGGLMKRIMPQLPKEGLCSVEYVPSKGKNAGELYRYYFYNGALIVWLKDSAVKDDENKTVSKQVKNDNLWADNLHQGIAKEGDVELQGGKKPERLMKKILEMATKPGDIVLDYHLGSGTTAAVAHKMGRQYIGIEQLYYGENDSVERLKNVINGDQTGVSKAVGWQGGGSFVYCNIKNDANIFKEKVKSAKEADLSKLLDEVLKSSFLSYRVDPKKVNKKEFEKLSLADKKRILSDLVDNNTLYMNYSEIDDASYDNSAEDKKFNKQFYTEID